MQEPPVVVCRSSSLLLLVVLLLLSPSGVQSASREITTTFASNTATLSGSVSDDLKLSLHPSSPGLEDGPYLLQYTLTLLSPTVTTLGFLANVVAEDPTGNAPVDAFSLPDRPTKALSGISVPHLEQQSCELFSLSRSVAVQSTDRSVYMSLSLPSDSSSFTYELTTRALNTSSFVLPLGHEAISSVGCGSMEVYAVNWTSTEGTLVIDVATPSSQNAILFVRYGAVPTITEFDLRTPFTRRAITSFSSQGPAIGRSTFDTPLKLGMYYIGVAADVASFTHEGYPRPSVTSSAVCCSAAMDFSLKVLGEDLGDSYTLPTIAAPGIIGLIGLVMIIGLSLHHKSHKPNVALFGRYANALMLTKFNTDNANPANELEVTAIERVLVSYPNSIFGSRSHWLSMVLIGVLVNGPLLVLNYLNAYSAHQGREASVCHYNALCKRDTMLFGLGIPAFNSVWTAPSVYIVCGVIVILWTALFSSHRVPAWVDMVHYRSPAYALYVALGISLINTGIATASYNLCPNRFIPTTHYFFLTSCSVWLCILLILKISAISGSARNLSISGRGSLPWILALLTGLGVASLHTYQQMVGWNWVVLPVTISLAALCHVLFIWYSSPTGKEQCRTVRTFVARHWVQMAVIAFVQIVFVLIAALGPIHPSLALMLDVDAVMILLLLQFISIKLSKQQHLSASLVPDESQPSTPETKFVHIREQLPARSLLFLLIAVLGLTVVVAGSLDEVRDAGNSSDTSAEKSSQCVLWTYDSLDVAHMATALTIAALGLFVFHMDDDVIEPTSKHRTDPIPDGFSESMLADSQWQRQKAILGTFRRDSMTGGSKRPGQMQPSTFSKSRAAPSLSASPVSSDGAGSVGGTTATAGATTNGAAAGPAVVSASGRRVIQDPELAHAARTAASIDSEARPYPPSFAMTPFPPPPPAGSAASASAASGSGLGFGGGVGGGGGGGAGAGAGAGTLPPLRGVTDGRDGAGETGTGFVVTANPDADPNAKIDLTKRVVRNTGRAAASAK